MMAVWLMGCCSCNSPLWGLLRAVPSRWGDPATRGSSNPEGLGVPCSCEERTHHTPVDTGG